MMKLVGPSRFNVLQRITSIRSSQFNGFKNNVRNISTSRIPFPEKLAFAFDIDGVLKQGHHNVLPQAKRVLSFLSGKDGRLPKPVPFILITNGGGVPDAERREALSSELGVQLSPNQLVQSHTPVQSYVHQFADKPVLIVGGHGDSCRRVAESYGLKHAFLPQDIIAWNPAVWDRTHLTKEEEGFVKRDVDFSKTPFSAIFVLHDTHDWGRDAMIITELLSSKGGQLGTQRERRDQQKEGGEIPLIFTNPDLEWRSDYPLPRFGMGAFRLSVEAVYKATTGLPLIYTQYGKPLHTTYAFADNMLRNHLKSLGRKHDAPMNVYMVGDNPESDIAGANAYGWNSILLKTGVYQSGKPKHEPTVISADVEEGVMWAIERELNER